MDQSFDHSLTTMDPGIQAAMRVASVVCVLGVIAVFVFLHTGARADALCARDGASVPDGLSWLPPGTHCSGGLPVRTVTKFDPLVILAIPGIAVLVFGAAAFAQSRAVRART
jgi:hypothetical protein